MSAVFFSRWAKYLPDVSLQFQGIQTDDKGHIIVDEFQNTTVKGVYAVGDVCGKALLTPGNISSFGGDGKGGFVCFRKLLRFLQSNQLKQS